MRGVSGQAEKRQSGQNISLPRRPGEELLLSRAGPATLARLAAMAAQAGRTAVLVSRDRAEHAAFCALAALFSPDLSTADLPPSQPVWQQAVVSLPQGLLVRDGFPDWSQRLAALHALTLRGPRIVVASPESLLLRWPSPAFLSTASLELSAGARLSQEALLEQMTDWGYSRVPMVTRAGELSRRGDILDIYAPGCRHPLRLEFFDDTLEEIRLFDADTQHSLLSVPEVTLLPARPYFLDRFSRDQAGLRLETLHREGRLDDNALYDCRQALDAGGRTLLPGTLLPETSLLEDWLPGDSLFLSGDAEDMRDALRAARADLAERLQGERAQVRQPLSLCLRQSEALPWEKTPEQRGFPSVCAEPLVVGVAARGLELRERPVRTFQELFPDPGAQDRPWQQVSGLIRRWIADRRQVLLSFSSGRRRDGFLRLAAQDGLKAHLRYAPGRPGLFALISPFREGAELDLDAVCILGEKVVLPRQEKTQRVSAKVFQGLDAFDDLRDGELLVHRDYGIGRFRGLKSLETDGLVHDFLLLEYQGADRLYVPVDRMDSVQRYRTAEGGEPPALDRLGSAAWMSGRDRARKAIEKIAADLMEMYAYRKVAKGFRYDPPDELYREFEAAFGYEATPDQARAIEDVLADMDKPEPMDRLICGDVGFGKTEVAMRAAFRAAANGRQVALLCPTTVLAEQHFQTFRARMKGFPVNIGLLSRFVSPAGQRQAVAAAARGETDILIGTHRLLSADVHLPRLGLLILDEEQRFGVRHKELLKEMKKTVDVLTLTATPIPRTLQLSMSGIRELSLIETPPMERKPVITAVLDRSDEVLQSVVRREMAREGQVFWVHNRIQGLARTVDYVKRLVPEARVAMAHGRMPEEEVEANMRRFWHGELDVLVCTAIIESGLDFPGANTLIVEQTQNFGLGQLYQLRGRVGRSDRQAYAYFVVPDARHMPEHAQERLRILQDMDFLGAGFRVAMEDLRLRGAGNILGEAQTGQMTRVGLDLYLEMLEQAVERLKGTVSDRDRACELNIGVAARIPETYIRDSGERLRQYRALTGAVTGQERERIALGIRDRFGPFPEDFQTFLAVLDFKQFLGTMQVERADLGLSGIRLTWSEGQTAADPVRILRYMQQKPGARFLPPATLTLPVPETVSFIQALSLLRQELEDLRLRPGEEPEKVVLVSKGSGGPGRTPARPGETVPARPRRLSVRERSGPSGGKGTDGGRRS